MEYFADPVQTFHSVSKDDVMKIGQYKENPLTHPETIHRRHGELENFMASSHKVTLVILRALAEQLGLDPEVLLNLHKLEQPSGDQARVTFAPPVREDVITLGEHTGKQNNVTRGRCASC